MHTMRSRPSFSSHGKAKETVYVDLSSAAAAAAAAASDDSGYSSAGSTSTSTSTSSSSSPSLLRSSYTRRSSSSYTVLHPDEIPAPYCDCKCTCSVQDNDSRPPSRSRSGTGSSTPVSGSFRAALFDDGEDDWNYVAPNHTSTRRPSTTRRRTSAAASAAITDRARALDRTSTAEAQLPHPLSPDSSFPTSPQAAGKGDPSSSARQSTTVSSVTSRKSHSSRSRRSRWSRFINTFSRHSQCPYPDLATPAAPTTSRVGRSRSPSRVPAALLPTGNWSPLLSDDGDNGAGASSSTPPSTVQMSTLPICPPTPATKAAGLPLPLPDVDILDEHCHDHDQDEAQSLFFEHAEIDTSLSSTSSTPSSIDLSTVRSRVVVNSDLYLISSLEKTMILKRKIRGPLKERAYRGSRQYCELTPSKLRWEL